MVYKYFSINQHSLSNLIRNELFCNNYKAFNDPFECWFILEEDRPNPKLNPERFEKICNAWGWKPSDMKSDWDMYEEYMEELEGYQPDIGGYIEGSRISCFSKEIDNLLMWAHYADGMRGFCLEFDEQKLLSLDTGKDASIIPVCYSEKPPVVDKMLYALAKDQIWYHEMALSEEPNGSYVKDYMEALKDSESMINDLYSKTIASKPIQWEYEKEVRLVYYSDKPNNHFFSYPQEAITKIIFGERIDLKSKETLTAIMSSKKTSIEVLLAHRTNRSYDINFKKF